MTLAAIRLVPLPAVVPSAHRVLQQPHQAHALHLVQAVRALPRRCTDHQATASAPASPYRRAAVSVPAVLRQVEVPFRRVAVVLPVVASVHQAAVAVAVPLAVAAVVASAVTDKVRIHKHIGIT